MFMTKRLIENLPITANHGFLLGKSLWDIYGRWGSYAVK